MLIHSAPVNFLPTLSRNNQYLRSTTPGDDNERGRKNVTGRVLRHALGEDAEVLSLHRLLELLNNLAFWGHG